MSSLIIMGHWPPAPSRRPLAQAPMLLRRWLVTTWTAILCVGCASDRAAVEGEDPRSVEAALATDAPHALGPGDEFEGGNGLLVVKWVIADSPATIAAALGGEADASWSLPEPARGGWQRNGLRIIRVPADRIDSLQQSLGGASVSLRQWSGQMVEWQRLVERSIGADGRAVAVDGVVRRFEPGRLQLAARGWTLTNETGSFFHLELAAQHLESRGLRVWNESASDDHRELFDSIGLELELEAGFAYVLTCESPQAAWGATGGHAGDSIATPDSAAVSFAPVSKHDGASTGPDVVAPLTLGEALLLSETGLPSRGVIIFLPRIPAHLMPAEL